MSEAKLSYRLVIALDIEQYSKRNASEQLQVQEELRTVLDSAAARTGLDRQQWHQQVCGDGELCVLPEKMDVLRVVGCYMQELGAALRRMNEHRAGSQRPLRLRVAVHHGTLTSGPFDPAGDAPIVVSRLLDAAPLRRRLAENRDVDLALVVSDPIYQDVIRTDFSSLNADEFRAIRVVSKGATYRGHIYYGSLVTTESSVSTHPGVDSSVTNHTNVLAFRGATGRIGGLDGRRAAGLT